MGKKSGGKQSYPYRAGKPVNRNKSRGWFGSQVENGLKKSAMPKGDLSMARMAMLNSIRPQAGQGDWYALQAGAINRKFDALERMEAIKADPDSGAPPTIGGFTSGAGVSYHPDY